MNTDRDLAAEDRVERFFAVASTMLALERWAEFAAWWRGAAPESRAAFEASFAPASGDQLTAIARDYGVERGDMDDVRLRAAVLAKVGGAPMPPADERRYILLTVAEASAVDAAIAGVRHQFRREQGGRDATP